MTPQISALWVECYDRCTKYQTAPDTQKYESESDRPETVHPNNDFIRDICFNQESPVSRRTSLGFWISDASVGI